MKVNEIYLGDAYKLIKEIPDKSVDLIYTDPPYEYDSGMGKRLAEQGIILESIILVLKKMRSGGR